MQHASSGAFLDETVFEPTGQGPLDGLRFAVKDLVDLAGLPTGCGNPSWRDSHPRAVSHAVCVEQVLAAGARCVGKTVTDELAFSLLGENEFYGTPLNPRAPDRVPGGSSSGSASAVAGGLVDFAIGTDTGGSVRVPASNCGILGLRPTHGSVSVAGVYPFAPTFDTVGLLAADLEILTRAACVLLAREIPESARVRRIHALTEAFDLAEPAVAASLYEAAARLADRLGVELASTSLRAIDADPAGQALDAWYDTYCQVQWPEIWSQLGPRYQATGPELSSFALGSLELTRKYDRSRSLAAIRRREDLAARLVGFLGPDDLLCIPTVHTPAPLKGSHSVRGFSRAYYSRALALTAISGIGRLPALSLPLAEVDGLPVGLCLMAGSGQDAFLLAAARQAVAAPVR